MANSDEKEVLFVIYKINKCNKWDYKDKPTNCSSWNWVGTGATQFVNLPREEQFSGNDDEKILMLSYLNEKFNTLHNEGIIEEYCFFDKYPISIEEFQNNKITIE
jgi:hypothetical protein